MSTFKKHHSENFSNCVSKVYTNQYCDNDCVKNDGYPFGITIIPGSGKLSEFPLSNADGSCGSEEGPNIFDCLKSLHLCPRAYPPTTVCIRDNAEFMAICHINFINGDLVISDPDVTSPSSVLLQILPAPMNDAVDVFPNLLGVNGNIYIINTQYRRITGFQRLRFVTGSIVIVNNPNLIIMPTFPSLLSVGGLVTTVTSNPEIPPFQQCGRSAIIIANNAVLKKVNGFEALRQVKDGIFISNNPGLTHICGFIHLYRTDRVVINDNSHLTKIIGFCYTDTLNIGLYLFNNNLSGEFDLIFSAFITLETAQNVVVINNNGLKIFKLDSLRTVAQDFVIRANNQLEELSSSLQYVDDIFIESNKSLQVVKLCNLQEVNNTFNINNNCALTCLDDFNDLRRVGHGIMISDNRQLVELKGFNKIKYIGSSCISRPLLTPPAVLCNDNNCFVAVSYDWTEISQLDCVVVDTFPVNTFDSSINSCGYSLPTDFFRLLCNVNTDEIPDDEEIPTVVSYSIIIFRNQRLKAIGGFCNLKHIESNLYIINNSILHTINAFGQLAYALDIWIRNNSVIKYIIGFCNLLSVRDFVVYESSCLLDLNSIKLLEFAQQIAIEAKTTRSVKYPRTPIPSVLGYTLYYSFDRKC